MTGKKWRPTPNEKSRNQSSPQLFIQPLCSFRQPYAVSPRCLFKRVSSEPFLRPMHSRQTLFFMLGSLLSLLPHAGHHL